VRVLGVGGTGIVYELLHNTNGTRFAMKEMEIKTSYQMQVTAHCLCCAALFCNLQAVSKSVCRAVVVLDCL
jgi:hypothetical protein